VVSNVPSKPMNLLLVELQDLEIWLLNREMPNSARTVTDVIKLLMSPAPETSGDAAAGLRKYVFQQLGFLTDDDNAPAERLLRIAAAKLGAAKAPPES
jgi:hypothetical protein